MILYSSAGYLSQGIKNIFIYMLYQDTGYTSRVFKPRNKDHYHTQAVSGYRIHQQDI
jgi:hypothetical protein